MRAAKLTFLENAGPGGSLSGTAETEHRLRLADGRLLACLELGDSSGPPVLYFHGYPGSRLEARVAGAAAQRLGLRLLAVDRMASPDRDLFADPWYRSVMLESTAEALRQGGRGAAWELTLIARPWDFHLQDVRMSVDLWQGLVDQILPAAMARRLADALPACKPRYLPGEGHLSLVVRHIEEVLADLRR